MRNRCPPRVARYGLDGLMAMAIALVSVLSGALVTLFIVYVTSRLSRTSEHEKWLRESRFAVYTEFLAAIDEVRHKSGGNGPDLDAALLRYRTARHSVLLLAGTQVARALRNWGMTAKSVPDKRWYQRPFSEIWPSYNEVLNAMDSELGVTRH